MDRLVIRDGELRGAITSVRASRAEFADAVSRTDALQEAVGHRRLSNALQGFESRWSVRREKLVSSLDTIEKQLQGVLDKFGEWDTANTAPGAGPVGPAPAPATTDVQAAAPPSSAPAPIGPAASAPAPVDPVPSDVPQPTEAAPESLEDASEPEPSADTTSSPESPDGGEGPAIPGSPEAINALLDRLEELAGTPAGAAALAGAIGALVVLLALLGPGSASAPGLAGVDPARIQQLLDQHASTVDPLAELSTPSGTSVAITPDVDQQLNDLAASTEDGSVEEGPGESQETGDEAAGVEHEVGDERAADPELTEDVLGLGPAPAAPDAGVAPASADSALSDLPPPPAPIESGSGAPATSDAFEERFPRDGISDVQAPVATGASVDVEAELSALAADGDGDTGGTSAGGAARMAGMPMAAAGMASMAAGSQGAGAQAKAVDARDDERLAAVRRELDELRASEDKGARS